MISKQTHDEVMRELEEWTKTWILPGIDTPGAQKQRQECIEDLLYKLVQIPGNKSYMDTAANLYKAWMAEK